MTTYEETLPGPGRRTVVATIGAAGLAAALTACGGGGSGGDSTAEGDGGGVLAKTADIPVGGGKVFKDAEVVVTQPTKGEFKAFSSLCTHKGCPVTSVENGTVNCPCHGSKFDIADGSVRGGPAPKPLPAVAIAVTGGSIKQA
ncbi:MULTISPECIES: Rieske (2Fe-2S) protein [Streptomyces]|uniref:Cytochrome bc1 complex Rieske iron-sulfur subunit n=1 Tax=Streptomyces venezuelae TaxID=54571 RepID=A0A5P2B6P0_STRVZ|nr:MULTISPECIES: Rieske (2Fe-2S) protein [Streptomyces]NEA03336.1 Rieske (2Fe-2S) protein [Streptomyces sp. SID10116]MYY83823.1 Rieske 2Fe-2S domain-containing protein [Streptomyces sp. SID335]MYZ12447.1 Rieske 2Fe-2S domain-containing protein [Streptomyces sp. SID337]NDZ87381.1 Rieske (2Fe-2S) protein [Streptomyces sp. SID10115]NEB50250.1 Rieske (2Fe-2S) protein [Streptomyces sp. SID339]